MTDDFAIYSSPFATDKERELTDECIELYKKIHNLTQAFEGLKGENRKLREQIKTQEKARGELIGKLNDLVIDREMKKAGLRK